MKMKNKNKVHPFISSSSSSSNIQHKDPNFSVLNLLPAAIFTLLSVLSMEDREVLAYMITRSLKSTTNYSSFFPSHQANQKKSSKKTQCCHKSPAMFECECFHCYTIFWFRWDSSPNRDLIHRAIEAFEDHLNNGGQLFEKTSSTGKNSKRKDKISRRKGEKANGDVSGGDVLEVPAPGSVENIVNSPEIGDVEAESEVMENFTTAPAMAHGHKGLARKMLPDVIGILNSRLWSLWSPNV